MSLPPIGLLTVVTFLPAVGALLILLLVPRRHEEALRWGGLVVSLATFAASVPLWTGFDAGDADMQFEELLRWMPGLGVGYHVRSEEHTSELQSPCNLVCRLLLEKKKKTPARVR